jgi:hypothetical protein
MTLTSLYHSRLETFGADWQYGSFKYVLFEIDPYPHVPTVIVVYVSLLRLTTATLVLPYDTHVIGTSLCHS